MFVDGDESREAVFEDKLVRLNRVTKAVKGGRKLSFASLVVVGNKKGEVGYGQGKANDVSESIRKATSNAKKGVQKILTSKGTIPYQVVGKFKASRIIMKPASPGTGIIAGGAVRIVMDLCGIRDILCKSMGSRNPINVVKAVFDGFSQLSSVKSIASQRDKSVDSMWG